MYTPFLMLLLAPVAQDDASLSPPVPRPSQETPFDAPEHANRIAAPRAAFSAPPAWNQVEDPTLAPRIVVPREKTTEGPAPTFTTGLSIRERMVEVLVDEPGDGRVWARGLDYRASFGVEGFSMYPVFGKQSPREYPVDFAVRSVRVGGEPLALGAEGVTRNGTDVTIAHPSMREVYHLALGQVEQTFVFDTLPAAGDLVVEIGVSSDLQVFQDEAGIHFVHESFGHVSYGDAFVLDAAGARMPIAREWAGDGITLRVPASFVANAVMPLTIDPPVTAFSSTFGANDDTRPDICWDGQSNLYWVVWQEYTSATNADCYLTNFTTGGTQGTSFAVESTTDSWTDPKIAYHYGANRLLVVASEETPTAQGSIQGRLVNAGTQANIGAEFQISTCCFLKHTPDVGGTNWDSLTNNHFCVVWAFEAGATDRNVQYRIVDWDGTFVTAVTTVESSADDTVQTVISDTMGDADLLGDWWTIAWVRDTNNDGQGSVEARRVVWSGVSGSGAGNFVVESATNCSWPSVTSRLDFNLEADADRPSIIAYERDFSSATGPGGRQRSIYAKVVTDGMTFANNPISLTLEDVDGELDQRNCCIATDGNAFFLTYSEIYHASPGGSDFDMYMLSGHLSQTSTNAYLALMERHENMAFSGSPERFGRVATIWDGESSSTSDNAAAIWVDLNGTNGGTLEGFTLEAPTTDVSPIIAVGRQFCDANPNSRNSSFSADVSSWVWIDGTQALPDNHRVYCVDVPSNALGYLLSSRTTANINMPAGSQGRLCLNNAGRYVNLVQSSGASGTYTTTVSPLNLATPGGFVPAAAGETWHFQYWHRDLVGGIPTSNFSNAASVTFAP